jgi:hypothetical protein
MKLDSRILEGKRPLTCIDVEQAREFVGKECIFSDYFLNYVDIEKFNIDNDNELTGILSIDDNSSDYIFINARNESRYRFILPCEWVKKEPTPKHIDFEVAKKDKNFERCELYGEELLFDTKNNIFYTSDGNVHAYLTTMAQHRYNEEQTKEVVIEKKYRPYTVMEFIKEYPLGSHLHFRPKSKLMEMHRLIDGYNDCLNGAGTLFLCGAMYSMSELYDNYDIFKDGEWRPFGVEVKEK